MQGSPDCKQIIDRYLHEAEQRGYDKRDSLPNQKYTMACAEKAVTALLDHQWINGIPANDAEDLEEAKTLLGIRRNKVLTIICESFGLKPKDECLEAFEKAWASLPGWVQKDKGDCYVNFKINWERDHAKENK